MEFSRIVDALSSSSDESDLSNIVQYAVQHELTDSEIAHLANKLAASGILLKQLPDNGLDIASTGGPSSLSTLLTPLFLRHMNRSVPKLSVSGRPARGIDVLATIPGYRYRSNLVEKWYNPLKHWFPRKELWQHLIGVRLWLLYHKRIEQCSFMFSRHLCTFYQSGREHRPHLREQRQYSLFGLSYLPLSTQAYPTQHTVHGVLQ